MPYEHGDHAGNPGDVWKHLILWEVLSDCVSEDLGERSAFIYAETHAGRPEYPDRAQLREYCLGFGLFRGESDWMTRSGYFRVESEAAGYLGSSTLAHRLVVGGLAYELHLWDSARDVADSLEARFADELGRSVYVRCEDGYDGLRRSRIRPHLLLVDPPCADWRKVLAILRNEVSCATVLAWYPLHSSYVRGDGLPALSKEATAFERKAGVPVFRVQWSPAERNTRPMIGCGVAVKGASDGCLGRLGALLPDVARRLAGGRVSDPFNRVG